MLSASAVLNQTHDKAIFGVSINNERGNFALPKRPIGLEPALAAHQLVSWPVRMLAPSHRYRPLETKLRDVRDDLLEDPLAAHARVHHGDEPDGDHLDSRDWMRRHHATSRRLTGAAISYKGSRVSNR